MVFFPWGNNSLHWRYVHSLHNSKSFLDFFCFFFELLLIKQVLFHFLDE